MNPQINDACTNLKPGQKLCLGYKGQDCRKTYTVINNDTCDAIAKSHKLDASTLYANNPQINKNGCDNIYIGEVLAICGDKKVTPTPPGKVPKHTTPPPGKVPAVKKVQVTKPAPPTTKPAPPATKVASASVNVDANEDDLPFCEDPNDDGW